MKDSTGADLQHSLKTADVLLARVGVVLPTAQAISKVGNLERENVKFVDVRPAYLGEVGVCAGAGCCACGGR